MAADSAIQRKRVPALVLRKGSEVVQTLPLTKARITIGRRTFNDLVIESPSVSAEHAVVLNMLDAFCYEDIGSTNGSHINGEKVARHFLNEGDVIEFGVHTVEFCLCEQQEETSPSLPSDLIADVIIESEQTHGSTMPIVPETVRLASLRHPPLPLDHLPKSAKAAAIVRIISGARSGQEFVLNKSLTTIGYPGRQVGVINPVLNGWRFTQVEGLSPASINARPVAEEGIDLADGDIISMDDVECLFYVDWWRAERLE